MRSVLRSVRKRKKSRRLGEVDIISREEYAGFDVDAKVEMIRALVPLGLMHVQELLDDEVTELAGARHARKESLVRGRRHGSNPGTVRLAGQRVPIRVPRVRSVAGGEIPLRSYEAAREDGQVNDVLLKRVLYGISCRNYEAAAESVPGAIGLSSSTVSRSFIQASAATLFQERPYRAQTKGKVERPIRYIRDSFFYGRAFAQARERGERRGPQRAGVALAGGHGQRASARYDGRAPSGPLRAGRACGAASLGTPSLPASRRPPRCRAGPPARARHHRGGAPLVAGLRGRGGGGMTATASDRRDRLRAMLADLKMPGALEAVDGVLAQVDSGAVTAGEAIELVLNAQIALRNNRRLQAAMRSSRLPAVKTLAQFDFTFQPSIKREQIESLHELGFLDRAENVILLGPPGVGKTHLAISLAIAAAEAGRRVYYGTLAGLIDSLMEARAAGELSRRLRVLTHPALLVVDEIGYLPVSQDGAVLFFQLINARHERASTVLTSNKGFEEWGHVLGDEIMAAALIDRLLHHCHIVNIRGNSYRMREHQHWLRAASEQQREGVAT